MFKFCFLLFWISLFFSFKPGAQKITGKSTPGVKRISSGSYNEADPGPVRLPDRYFWLMEAGCVQVEERLNAEPGSTLETLEARSGWRYFPYSIMASSVLYAKKHPANKHYHDPGMLALSIRIGDLLASENEKGRFEPRLGSNWDTYMWLEAYRLLADKLGEGRKERWKSQIIKLLKPVEEKCTALMNTAWYNVPFLNTSPNHFSIYASELFLASKVFGIKSWEKTGRAVMHRFAVEEISPDGFWGEHNHFMPTTGYNYLTVSSVALYWEHSKDPSVLSALKRATDFHKNFTYPDGTPVEVINDRNRYWGVSPWGHFGFTHFPDGRRYAQFLAGFFGRENIQMDVLGRLAQDALYYHEGFLEPIPQDKPKYHTKMSIDAGIRKTEPWTVAYSGLISSQAIGNTFFLDRQGNLSIFHDKLGLIVTGANSKNQPGLATFQEKLSGQAYHMPINSRLQMNGSADRLSLGFNTFFTDLYVPSSPGRELKFWFDIHGKGSPSEEAKLNLQLCLKAGEILETAAGKKFILGKERIALSPAEIGGWIHHHGWKLAVDSMAGLVWPVYPHNPYANAPETSLEKAVGVITVPLDLKMDPKRYVRMNEKKILFTLITDQVL